MQFAIHIGNGDGTFSETYTGILINFDEPSVGDFNGDGFDDIVANSANAIGISLSNGDGTFGSVNYLAGIASPDDTDIADLNGDGNLDILTSGGGEIERFFGNGDGTFEAQTAITTSVTEVIEAVDLNGDGNLDIITGDASVSVFLGQDDGSFADEASYNLDVATLIDSLLIADFNDDGVLDIAQGTSATGLEYIQQETIAGITPLLEFSLANQSDAKLALPYFQRQLDRLSEQRGEIGSAMARIEVAESVLSVSAENFKAAESRIRDADVAQESANLVRLNILQQAASSVLGQANQQPQLALQLLGVI